MTSAPDKRFLAYADFLGTELRYSTPKLVRRGRELLEQALNRCVVPLVSDHDMHLNVFSDTAILTCPTLTPLLDCLVDLFGHFMSLHKEVTEARMMLWLRAGISYGTAMSVDHLRSSERVRTSPIIDTSLPIAYHLESIRPGGRVYVDPEIPDAVFVDFGKMFVKWRQITGGGLPLANVREYLWPAKHYKIDSLLLMTQRLNQLWSDELKREEWHREDYYRNKMIHLDETLKLFIRTCSIFCSESQRRDLLFSLIPNSEDSHVNVRFKWGVWFQALRGIAEHCEMTPQLDREFVSAFERVKTILKKGEYFEHFVGELAYPDYALFKSKLCELGLHENL